MENDNNDTLKNIYSQNFNDVVSNEQKNAPQGSRQGSSTNIYLIIVVAIIVLIAIIGVYLTIHKTSNTNITALSTNNSVNHNIHDENITFEGSGYNKNYKISKYLNGSIKLDMASGNSGYVSVTIIGANGKTYFSNSTDNWCISSDPATYNLVLPPMNYTISMGTGSGGGECGNAELIITKQ